jgi:hypothetical protein
VNGSSIVIDSCDGLLEIEYLHIKVAGHDLIFAEGAASETLGFSSANLRSFDNFAEYERLYGAADIGGPLVPFDSVSLPGGRARLRSHLRSALSPWVDHRTKFEVIRDRLQEGTLSPRENR